MPQVPWPQRHIVHVSRILMPLFPLFLDIQRRQSADMDQALAAGDQETLRRLAHAVKGAAGTFELPEAAALGARLEAAALAGDLAVAAALLDVLKRYYADMVIAFV